MTPADVRRLHPEAFEFLWRTILRREHGGAYRHIDAHGIDCLSEHSAYQIYHHQGAAFEVVQKKFREDLQAAQAARAKFKFDEWVFITTFPFKTPAQSSWLDDQRANAQPLQVTTWGDEDLGSHLARHPDVAAFLGLGVSPAQGTVMAGILAQGGTGGSHGIHIEGGVSIQNAIRGSSPDPILVRGKQIFSEAVSLLRATAGKMFRTSDGATSALPGALWYAKKRDWEKVVERIGEFERQRGRFRPYVEPSAFDGSDGTFVSAAEEVLRLYLWSSDNHPAFDAIRAEFGLPAPDIVNSLLNPPALRDESNRPRLIMEGSDDGRPVGPRNQRFVLENRGQTDAINVVLAPIVLPRTVITPATVRLLKSGGPAIEVVTDVEFTDRPGPVHEYDCPLGEALSNALRTVEDPRNLNKHGQIEQKVTASYSDPNGSAYEQAFLLRFNWAVRRFEPVEILSPAVRS